MRFAILLFTVLPMLVASIPVAVPDNASSQKANNLVNGINANLDAGNKELDAVTNLQGQRQNGASSTQQAAGKAQLQGALTQAVGDRQTNQANAGANTAVQAGLAKVQTAQGKAQEAVSSLNGGAADDATLGTLKTTFTNGFKTNENNIKLAQANNN